MLKAHYVALLQEAARRLATEGSFPLGNLPPFQVEEPSDSSHGDLAANWALVLSKQLKKNPREIALLLKGALPEDPWVQRAEVAGPGFLNLFLTPQIAADAILAVESAGDAFGCHPQGKSSVLVEFVSANPTGPMNVVSARAAAFGDSLGTLLRAAGHRVHKEYYVNDAGAQIEALGTTLEARIREAQGEPFVLPENGYAGLYMKEMAEDYLEKEGPSVLDKDPDDRLRILSDWAMTAISARQKKDLEAYGVFFDRFYSERRDLHDKGRVEAAIGRLQDRGMLFEKDGALWLRTTDSGDDKDRVVVRSDGRPTYFAADIAYHWDKYERGFDTLIDVLGPDHHGYIERMRAAVQALGKDPASFEVKLVQWIRLLRGTEAVSMSKRAGEFIEMKELTDEVGKDAARFSFLLRSADSPLDFDLGLAVRESTDNPVYYVQYAHARIASILRQAGEVGEGDLSLLGAPEEMTLAKKILSYPEEILDAAELREPHHIARFALDLAGEFHSFYNHHRVLGVEPELSAARVRLVRAVGQLLKNALSILGVFAPDSM